MRCLVVCFLMAVLSPFSRASEGSAFSFHLLNEPAEIDPQRASNASGSYLLPNLFRGLFRYDARAGLVAEMAKKCERKDLSLTCHLKPQARWSDGKRIEAVDFIRAFQFLIDPKNKNAQADLLFSIRNARKIWEGQLPPGDLGVHTLSPDEIRFEFAESDLEFEHKLALPAMTPRRMENGYRWSQASSLITNGPYVIREWNQGHQIRLKANKYYDTKPRPEAVVYFIDSDSTALRLYEAGKLSLLRRLVTTEIPRFKGRADFFQIPMARFDYIGFGPALANQPQLREALIESVDFANFQKIFDALGTPGCPSLPARWMDKVPCEKMNLSRARRLLSPQTRKKVRPHLQLAFSQLGGDDISRAAEWFQGQWTKNLNLKIPIVSFEQGTYLQKLKSSPPAIFRKGVGLNRPTCRAALEIFTSDSPENFIALRDPEYDRLVTRLGLSEDASEKRRLCREALEKLLAHKRIIPLGEIHFSVLADPRFKGWQINELNLLDLTDLTFSPGPKSKSIQ